MKSAPYQPANGNEGALFMERFCDRCVRDQAFRDGTGDSCPIIANSMVLDEDHEEYPPELTYDRSREPTCTAFTAQSSNNKGGETNG